MKLHFKVAKKSSQIAYLMNCNMSQKDPFFNVCRLMVLIRLIYENKGDIAILRIMFKKRLCKLSRVSVTITDVSNSTTFLRLHNFQSSSIVLPFSMSIFFVFTYIHHYTMHQC